MFKKRMVAVLVAGLFASGLASAQLQGSAHDFSTDGWNGTGEMCIVCHTPHNAITAGVSSNAPLWNHATTTATFSTYVGFDLESTPGQPSSSSLLCLSCHDGTVALDSFGGNTGSNFIGGGANFGTDLTNDHPIGVSYTDTEIASDGELQPLTNTYTVPVVGGVDTVLNGLLNNGTTVECASCHDVHNKNTDASLLKVNNANSALCTTCHAK